MRDAFDIESFLKQQDQHFPETVVGCCGQRSASGVPGDFFVSSYELSAYALALAILPNADVGHEEFSVVPFVGGKVAYDLITSCCH